MQTKTTRNVTPRKAHPSVHNLLLFLAALLCGCLLNLTGTSTCAADTAVETQHMEEELRALLHRKRKQYKNWFPEIEFVLLDLDRLPISIVNHMHIRVISGINLLTRPS